MFVCCIFFSCGKDEEEIRCRKIDLTPSKAQNELQLSTIVDSVMLIPLETNSESIMGRIYSIIIKDQFIYACDISQDIVFVFSKSGKFLSKLDRKGSGSQEYSDIGGFFVSDDEKYISVIDRNRNSRLVTYSNIPFEFISDKKTPKWSFNSGRFKNGAFYFAGNQLSNTINRKHTNAEIAKVKNGKVEKLFFDKEIVTGGYNFAAFTESFTINDKNELYASVIFDNTFYRLEGEDFEPVLRVGFNGSGIDNSIGEQSPRRQATYIKQSPHLASFPHLEINNSNILSFSYYMGLWENHTHYMEFKKSKKAYHVRKILNDITSFPNQIILSTCHRGINHEIWHKNYLVDIVLPANLFKDDQTTQFVEGVGEIKIDDNPVIVLMKLKENL